MSDDDTRDAGFPFTRFLLLLRSRQDRYLFVADTGAQLDDWLSGSNQKAVACGKVVADTEYGIAQEGL